MYIEWLDRLICLWNNFRRKNKREEDSIKDERKKRTIRTASYSIT